MKYARLFAAFAAVALALCSLRGSADTPPTVVSKTFSFVATGSAPTLTVTGASTCTIVVNGNGQGFAIIPEYSNDGGTTWLTANTVGGGNIQAIGTYSGVVSSASMTSFSFAVPALATGSIYGTESCSFTQSNGIVAGNGITVTGNAPAQTVGISAPVSVANGGTGASTLAAAPFVALNPASAQTGNVNVTGSVGAASIALAYGGDIATPNGANTVINFGHSGYGVYFEMARADGGTTEFASQGCAVQGVGGSMFCMNNVGVSAHLYALDTSGDLGLGGYLATSTDTIGPGYSKPGIVTLTTPATCSANTTCGTVAVTFSPAMVSAPECTATVATTPGYVFSSVAPSTSGVTFEFVTLNAISTATAVPVSYDCKV